MLGEEGFSQVSSIECVYLYDRLLGAERGWWRGFFIEDEKGAGSCLEFGRTELGIGLNSPPSQRWTLVYSQSSLSGTKYL